MSFLNMTGLGKQVKSAYSAGRLKVGAFEEHSVIVTPHCAFAVTEDHEPNKMKAIITEYLGYLPVYDETSRNAGFIEASKDTADRDLEPEETATIKRLIWPRDTKPYVITPVTITEHGTPVRIIQDVASNECAGIKQEYLDIISYKDLNYDIEGDPVGPEVDESTKLAYFKNATTILSVSLYTFSTDKAKEILDILRLLELREEKK
jgi:hypothetical protein